MTDAMAIISKKVFAALPGEPVEGSVVAHLRYGFARSFNRMAWAQAAALDLIPTPNALLRLLTVALGWLVWSGVIDEHLAPRAANIEGGPELMARLLEVTEGVDNPTAVRAAITRLRGMDLE